MVCNNNKVYVIFIKIIKWMPPFGTVNPSLHLTDKHFIIEQTLDTLNFKFFLISIDFK